MAVSLSAAFLAADFFLPPLLGFKYNIFIFLFLSVLLGFYTASFQAAIYGFAYSATAELIFGYRFGSIVIPFLAIFILIFWLNRFFSLGQFFSHLGLSGSLFYKVFSLVGLFYALIMLIALERKLAYFSQLPWENEFLFLWDPGLLATIVAGAFIASILLSGKS